MLAITKKRNTTVDYIVTMSHGVSGECPLLGAKRTCRFAAQMSANDRKADIAFLFWRSGELGAPATLQQSRTSPLR